MAKKKHNVNAQSDADIDKIGVIGKLTPAQYWKWTYEISKINAVKQEANISNLSLRNMELESTVHKLRSEILRLNAQPKRKDSELLKENVSKANEEFQKFRKELEKELGFGLEDCVINEYNYEVKKLN